MANMHWKIRVGVSPPNYSDKEKDLYFRTMTKAE